MTSTSSTWRRPRRSIILVACLFILVGAAGLLKDLWPLLTPDAARQLTKLKADGLADLGPTLPRASITTIRHGTTMDGLIGKMTAVPGQRAAFAATLLEGTQAMPGCLSYVIAADSTDPEGLWVTEVWDGRASHQASLALPGVNAAITKGRPLITGSSERVETVPIGGYGLPRAEAR